MFEYWFDTEEPFHGTTSDFLEVLCQIAEHFDSEVAGKFASGLMDDRREELTFLRVVEWNFEFNFEDPVQLVSDTAMEPNKFAIKLYYVPR